MSFGNFDFGLSPEQEKRARKLHRESIVIDVMFQGPLSYRSLHDTDYVDLRQKWQKQGSASIFIEGLVRAATLCADGMASDFEVVWRESGLTGANVQVGNYNDLSHGLRMKEFARYDWYSQALVAEDFRRAKRESCCVAFLNYQNVVPDVRDLDWFDKSHAGGVRMAGLTYNHPNTIGTGCTSDDKGLTPFGRDAVKRMNKVGMIVDVSHAGPRTTLDACKVSQKPVIASHTAARALFDHNRGKADEGLRAIAGTGGVIGVYAAPALLAPDCRGTIERTLDHVDYIADLVGVDHVALGTDWPMQLPKWMLERSGPFKKWALEAGFSEAELGDTALNLEGFDDYRDYPNITRGLVGRGYDDGEIRMIIGGNALRVFEAVCG